MSLPLLHAGRTNPGLSAALDLRFALDKSLTAYRGPTPSFSRASTGSYFDASGVLRYANVNLALYSEDFSNAYWIKSNATISTNQAIAPDGKNTADLLYPSSTGFARGIYYGSPSAKTISIYAKLSGKNWIALTDSSAATSAWFNLSTGTVGTVGAGYTAAIQNAGNGWYRCSLTKTTDFSYFQIYGTDSDNTLTATVNGTDGVFIWGAQAEASSTVGTYCPTTSSANSAPRFNHTYNGTSWVSRGLLVEEQRTNFSEYSESIENWTQDGAATTSNQASAPDGNSAADLVAETTSNSYHAVYNASGGSVTAGQTWTQSVFVKKGSGASAPDIVQLTHFGTPFGSTQYCNFNISSGVITASSGGTGSIVNCGNGWYRIAWTATAVLSGVAGVLIFFTNNNPSATRVPSYTGSTSANVFVWGGQVEQGSFATSYIRNLSTGSTTRSADVCQITGSDFSGFWNGTEGSVVAEYDYQGAISGGPLRLAEAPPGNQSVGLESSSGNLNCYVYNSTSGGYQALFSASPLTGSTNKTAFGFAANNFAASFNGASALTDNAGVMPTGVIAAYISLPGTITLNGHIARLRYYRKRLPNETLQLLSEPDPTLNLQFALNKSLTPVAGPAPSFSRASTGTYFNASGVLTTASINTPRFDHVYSGGQWVSKGLLVEEQRTNLALWSEDLSNGYWTKTNCSITADAIVSPDGNSNADLAEFSASGTAPRVFQTQSFSVTSGTSYTKSFFVKAGTQRWIQIVWSGGAHSARFANFDTLTMTFGTVSANVTTSVANVGNGWYRVSATSAATATALDYFWIYAVDSGTSGWASNSTSGGSVYVFGFQHEAGAFPTSYIGTTSSPVVRSADVCQITGTSFNWMWNQGEGSVASEFDFLAAPADRVSPRAWYVSDGAYTNGMWVQSGASDGFYVYQSGSIQAGLTATALGAGVSTKVSSAYKLNDFAASFNGASVLTDTTGNVPTVNRMEVGFMSDISGRIINGHIAKLIYYPARLTNAKLQQLST